MLIKHKSSDLANFVSLSSQGYEYENPYLIFPNAATVSAVYVSHKICCSKYLHKPLEKISTAIQKSTMLLKYERERRTVSGGP
jgi:hypothetical protein